MKITDWLCDNDLSITIDSSNERGPVLGWNCFLWNGSTVSFDGGGAEVESTVYVWGSSPDSALRNWIFECTGRIVVKRRYKEEVVRLVIPEGLELSAALADDSS